MKKPTDIHVRILHIAHGQTRYARCRSPDSGNNGLRDNFKVFEVLIIGIAAQSIGVAQAAFDATVKYAKTRKQFGRMISKSDIGLSPGFL